MAQMREMECIVLTRRLRLDKYPVIFQFSSLSVTPSSLRPGRPPVE